MLPVPVGRPDYQLYSESVVGTALYIKIGLQYTDTSTAPLYKVFKSLISKKYTNLISTVGCIGVSGYCKGSHTRDFHGRRHSQRTCVLLEVPSFDSSVT